MDNGDSDEENRSINLSKHKYIDLIYFSIIALKSEKINQTRMLSISFYLEIKNKKNKNKNNI